MIIESLVLLFVNFFIGLLSPLELAPLPFDAVDVLHDFVVYGSYVVGPDLLISFGSSVFLWAMAKLSIGIGIRIWELLPLT